MSSEAIGPIRLAVYAMPNNEEAVNNMCAKIKENRGKTDIAFITDVEQIFLERVQIATEHAKGKDAGHIIGDQNDIPNVFTLKVAQNEQVTVRRIHEYTNKSLQAADFVINLDSTVRVFACTKAVLKDIEEFVTCANDIDFNDRLRGAIIITKELEDATEAAKVSELFAKAKHKYTPAKNFISEGAKFNVWTMEHAIVDFVKDSVATPNPSQPVQQPVIAPAPAPVAQKPIFYPPAVPKKTGFARLLERIGNFFARLFCCRRG